MPPKSSTSTTATTSKTRAGTKAATEPTRKSSRNKGEAPEHAMEEDPEAVVHSEGGSKKRAAPSKPASTAAKKAKATPPAKKGKGKKKAVKDDDDEEEEEEEEEGLKPIELGDVLPQIVLKDENDEDVEVSELAGEKGVVIFTYPKADTPGCTSQACLYRDAKDEFAEVGYVIYGLSKDKPAAQNKWIGKNELSYPLLSDPSQTLIKALGCGGSTVKRSHFIFEKGTGKLIDKAIGVKPKDDSVNALEFISNYSSTEVDASKATGEPEAAAADEPASEEAGAEDAPAEEAATNGDAAAEESEDAAVEA